MTGILELPELLQGHGVTEMDVGSGGIDAELHAERPAERELRGEPVGRDDVHGPVGERLRRPAAHAAASAGNGRDRWGEPATPRRQGRSVATEMPIRGPDSTSLTASPRRILTGPAPDHARVHRPVDPERRAEAAGTGAEQPVGDAAATLAHDVQAGDRGERPQQDGRAVPAGSQTTFAHQCTP